MRACSRGKRTSAVSALIVVRAFRRDIGVVIRVSFAGQLSSTSHKKLALFGKKQSFTATGLEHAAYTDQQSRIGIEA